MTTVDQITEGQVISSTQLRVVFHGPSLAEQGLSDKELADVIQGVGRAFEAADHLANEGTTKVETRVIGVRSGSFPIEFQIIQYATELATDPEKIVAVIVLKSMLFNSLIPRIKRAARYIRGLRIASSPSDEAEEDDQVQEEVDQVQEDDPLLESQYRDPSLRSAITTIYSPLRKLGIDRAEIVDDNEVLDQSTKDDLPIFLDSSEDEDRLESNRLTMWFSIVQLPFRNSDEWRLTDGHATFTVTMLDKDFASRVARNEERFASSDRMLCTLETRQWQTEHGVRTEYLLLNVLDHPEYTRSRPA